MIRMGRSSGACIVAVALLAITPAVLCQGNSGYVLKTGDSMSGTLILKGPNGPLCIPPAVAPYSPALGTLYNDATLGLLRWTGSAWLGSELTFQLSGSGSSVSTINLIPTGGVSATAVIAAQTATVTLTRPPDVVCGGYLTRSGSNLLFSPEVSSAMWCYESGAWTYRDIPAAGITSAATGLTASTLYYTYAYWTGSALALDVSTTGTTTQNGIKVKSGATSRTLVAYCYANASGAITTKNEDAATQLISNVYNKQQIQLYVQMTTASWNYNSTTWRASNANNAWRIGFISDGKSAASARMTVGYLQTSGSNGLPGMGLDVTNATSVQTYAISVNSAGYAGAWADYVGTPSIGYHFLQAVERIQTGSGNVTFYGTHATGAGQAGIVATVYQ
jgi:hypothetical protein